MAGTVAAFLAMQDVYKATASKQREVAADMVAAWWLKTVSGNVVTTTVGTNTRQFVKLFDGSFIAPGAGAQASLFQTGGRSILEEPGCGSINYPTSRGWNYDSVSFTVTNASGDAQSFQPWKTTVSDANATSCAILRGHRLTTWTFPQGLTVNLVYAQPSQFVSPLLSEVNNSLGRKIRFNYTPGTYSDGKLVGIDNGLAGADLRSISIADDGTTATHTDPSGAVTKVKYADVNGRSLLNEVYDADDSATVPSIRYTYDTLQRAMEVRDAGNLQAFDARGPYQFFIANGVRAERRDPLGGRYTVYYDLDRRPLAVQDELARQTSIRYDGRGRVIEYVFPDGDKEQFEYDSRNNTPKVMKITKPCSPTPCTDPPNLMILASWNATWNKPDYVINARGFRTDFTYYSANPGRSLLQSALRPGATGSAPVGSSTRPTYTFTYNTYGQPVDTTDPTGLVTHNVYAGTASNLFTSSLNPTGINATTTYTYDANGDTKTVADPRGYVAEMDYDNDRRKTVTRHHDGVASANVIAAEKSTYDILGQLRKTEGATSFTGITVTAWQTINTKTYTPTGKILTETDNAGDVTTHTYDFADRETIVTDPESRRVATVYDAAGQARCTWRAWNSATPPTSCVYDPSTYVVNSPFRYAEYTYSPDGLQLTAKDANNNLTTNEYDGFNRLKKLNLPVTTKGAALSNSTDYEQYGYDENGNRTSLRKRDGNTILFSYDNLDRQILKDIPNSTALDVYSDFDLAGRPLYAHFVSATGSGVDYTYDGAKRLQSESTFGRQLTFAYDLSGNRTTLTYPDTNYTLYDFDAINRAFKIRENGATSGVGVLSTIVWDPLSRRDYSTRGNGVLTDYGYDAASRLNALSQDLAGTTNDFTRTFARNNAGQIRTRNTTGASYTWNAALSNKNYTPDGLNRYSDPNYSYDANGNLTGDGTRTFVYDVENRLTRVTSAGDQTDIGYDPLGRLYSTSNGSSVTQFLYEADHLIAEYNGAGALQRRYVHGPGADEPVVWYEGATLTNKSWLHTDERGSIIAASDSSGAATVYQYGPYGEPSQWSGSRFKYTGQVALPEVQLYYFKARVYDPILGRFLQTDPIGFKDDINLYAYTHDDPMNAVDSAGTDDRKDFDGLGGLREVLGDAKAGAQQAMQDTQEVAAQVGEHLKDHVSVKASAGVSAGLGVDASATIDGQTLDDGSIKADAKVVQTNGIEAKAGLTLNYRIGPKEVGPVECTVGAGEGLFGAEVSVGSEGWNMTLSVGPQWGAEVEGGLKTPVVGVGSGGRIPVFPILNRGPN